MTGPTFSHPTQVEERAAYDKIIEEGRTQWTGHPQHLGRLGQSAIAPAPSPLSHHAENKCRYDPNGAVSFYDLAEDISKRDGNSYVYHLRLAAGLGKWKSTHPY